MLNYDNIYTVYERIKNNTRNKSKIFMFALNLNSNVYSILKDLYDEKYTFGKYNIFLIKEPKYRIIISENISDKIVNHLISNYILLPRLDKSLIDSNVATRKGKGGSYAFHLFKKYVKYLSNKGNSIYVLKIDISKYFYNIDHECLIKMLKTKIKDEKAINLLSKIVDTSNENYVNLNIQKIKGNEIKRIKKLNISENEKNKKIKDIQKIPLYAKGKGLPIGNMTSQILATFYLNNVDRYIKEKLKFHCYIRYMDDLVILDNDKRRLLSSIKTIEKEINKCKLKINKKTRVYDLKNGVNFIGYLFRFNDGKLHVKISTKNYCRIKRKLKKMKKEKDNRYLKSLGSYNGFFNNCDGKIYNNFKKIYNYGDI